MSETLPVMSETLSAHCQICDRDVVFEQRNPGQWRTLACPHCGSASRQRALWRALHLVAPGWRRLAIHESSPGWDIVSRTLAAECPGYVASQYVPELEPGTLVTETRLPCGRFLVQDLERQTFADGQFDLFIAQDVFEHAFDPAAAMREIARTLKAGGLAIMTVPVVRGFNPSLRRARMRDGQVQHLPPPEYHGNPVGDGALVTVDWGFDIAQHLATASGMRVVIQTMENHRLGICDEVNQVVVAYKGPLAPLDPA